MSSEHFHENRFHYLDSTRGLASIIVIVSHLLLAINFELFNYDNQFISTTSKSFANIAVSYFFVLSGFVLSIAFYKNNINLTYFCKYCISRIFRIYPSYLLVTVLSFTIMKFYPAEINNIFFSEWYKEALNLAKSNLSFSNLIDNCNLVKNSTIFRLLPQNWTLYIELSVSIFAFMFFALSTFMPEVMMICVYIGIKKTILIGLEPVIFSFILGSYIYARKNSICIYLKNSNLIFYGVLFSTFSLLLVEIIVSKDVLKIINLVCIDLSALISGGFLIIVLSSAKIQKFLTTNYFLLIGDLSYSIYLSHFFFIFLLFNYIHSGLNILPIVLLVLICTFIFSIFLTKFIEKPFIQTGKYIIKLLFKIKK